MKLILFDVDGTLIDSQAIIHESMRQTFFRFGYKEPNLAETKSIIGLTLDRAIATIMNREIDSEVMAMTVEYKESYLALAKTDEMQSMPYTGIPGLIDRLSKRNDILMGVVTGKSRRGVQKLLQSPYFSDRFAVSRCADDCPSKPHPAMVRECCEEMGISPHNTIVVGDTSFDMEMALSAGASAVGVSWGYHSVERIISAGAQQVVHSVSVLENSLSAFVGPVKSPAERVHNTTSLIGYWSLQNA